MKNLIIFGLFLMLLFSCKSAKELAQDGKYDKAFNKVIGNLKKKPSDSESLQILKLSFDNANRDDLNRINQLSFKNSPDRWDEVAKLYKSLQDRHDKMHQILPFLDYSVQSEIKIFDYTFQIMDAQKNAADYKYSRGIFLLDMGNKLKAREALDYFKQVKKYDANYQDIDALIDEAYFKGTNHILFDVKDYTQIRLPQDYLTGLVNLGNNPSLNSTWVQYYTIPQKNIDYDYIVQLGLNYIRWIPERIDSKTEVHKRTVEDGWEYERDRRGDIIKDEKGNPIKRIKTREIQCKVVETTQTKSIIVEASLNYIQTRTNRSVQRIPIVVEQPFVYTYVNIFGDKDALPFDNGIRRDCPTCNERTRREQSMYNDRGPVPFPSNIEMIYMSRERLYQLVSAALMDNNYRVRGE